MAANYKLYVLELFRGYKGGIERNCQADVLANTILPQAISIPNGVW